MNNRKKGNILEGIIVILIFSSIYSIAFINLRGYLPAEYVPYVDWFSSCVIVSWIALSFWLLIDGAFDRYM